MAEELAREVAKWLRKQGYPLEMLVARGLRDAGFLVSQSDHYEDVDTGLLREIDVAARVGHAAVTPGQSRPLMVSLSILAECKLSLEKPWVVFRSHRSMQTTARDRPSSPAAAALVHRFADAWDGTLLTAGRHELAYGVTQAFTTGADVAYAACQGAIKAALAEIQSHAVAGAEQAALIAAIAVPSVVIQGRLFEAYLADDEEVHVDEVSSALVTWRVADPLTSYAINLVTSVALPEFERRARETTLSLARLMTMMPWHLHPDL